jgi:hypothetical protein
LLAGRALAEMEMEHHTRGSLVWVNDAQAGWVKGEVLGLEGSKLRVRTETGVTRLCSPADCPLQNPSSRMGVEVRLSSMPALAGVALGLCGRPHGLHLARGGLGRARTCAFSATSGRCRENVSSTPATGAAGCAVCARLRRRLALRGCAGHDNAVVPE